MSGAAPESADPNENRPFALARIAVPGTTNVVERHALIDTGGQVTLISHSLFNELNAVFIAENGDIHAADRTRMRIAGITRLRVTVPPFDTRDVLGYVAGGDLGETDVLIGMDYLAQFKFAIREGTFGAIYE